MNDKLLGKEAWTISFDLAKGDDICVESLWDTSQTPYRLMEYKTLQRNKESEHE